MNIQQFKRQQVVSLIVFVADSCSRCDLCEQQIVEWLIDSFQSCLQLSLFFRKYKHVGAASAFDHCGFHIAATDHTKLVGLADECIDMFVDLLVEVANFFAAVIFNSHEADLPYVRSVFVGVRHGLHVCAGSAQHAGDGFVNQWPPGFGTSFVASDHVLVVFAKYMSILLSSAPGQYCGGAKK